MAERIWEISVGLFAYFGPYVVQISALFLGKYHEEEASLIRPGVNFLTMESISMLPPQCDGVVIVAWGVPVFCTWMTSYRTKLVTWAKLKESSYHGMKLVLNQYVELSE
eukprot:12844036-Ditylum_brightwellii.AAC.2